MSQPDRWDRNTIQDYNLLRQSLKHKHTIVLFIKAISVFSLVLIFNTNLYSNDYQINLQINLGSYSVNESFFSSFEASNTGVKVTVVESDIYLSSSNADELQEYVRSADVVYVNESILNIESTRSRYFLDILPLISTDTDPELDGFFQNVFDSYRWDGGQWGIPTAFDLQLLEYDPESFESVGLAYPTSDWTQNDLMSAIRQLDNGNNRAVLRPYSGTLIRSLYGRNFYVYYEERSIPEFQDPQLAQLLYFMAQDSLESENSVFSSITPAMSVQTLPLIRNRERAYALMPGGHAGIMAQGFAISAGTQYPEIAYELIKYLSNQSEFILQNSNSLPAQREIYNILVNDIFDLSDEGKQLIEDGIENGLNSSSLLFSIYIENVSLSLNASTTLEEIESSLMTVEEVANENLSRLAETHADETFTIVPALDSQTEATQATLKFGIGLHRDSYDRQRWEEAASDFVPENFSVLGIELIDNLNTNEISDMDCFYYPYAQSFIETSELLPLNPLLSSDQDFDQDDFIGDSLEQFKSNDTIWGYPINLIPIVLWFDPNRFDEAFLPYPDEDWNVSEFTDALLKLADLNDGTVLASLQGISFIDVLIASYGGLPFDYRVSPPSLNFVEPNTVEAIRQVLDFARQDMIRYQVRWLPREGANGGIGAGEFEMYAGTTSDFYPYFNGEDFWISSDFPSNQSFKPMFYAVNSAYINSHTLYASECYQWIKTISARPDLYNNLPASRRVLSLESTASVFGPDIIEFFQRYDSNLQNENAIVFTTFPQGQLMEKRFKYCTMWAERI